MRIPGSYYYGIFNKNGNVDIKNNSDVDISSDISSNNGICTDTGGDLTIEDSTVKLSANGLAANLKGNVSIKDSTIELTKTANHHEVIRTGNSSTANTIDLSGSGSVTLTALGNQSGSSMIGGTVSLVGNTKCETGTYYSSYQNYSGAYNATNGKTVLKFMHDATTPTASVGDVTIAGTTGTAITDKDVVITLTNDKFYSIDADTVVSSWFTNLPAGLEAKIKTKVNDNDITATIKISGNPSVASSAALAITIPEAKLVTSTSALDVMSNPNAKFAITAPATPIAVPTANSVTYDGTEKTGVNDGTGYTLSGTYKATDVGATNYTATATLDAHFSALYKGEEIMIPRFEFARQMRNDSLGTPLRLEKNEIAIFEGIHALNDDIAGRHPEATKLYISARSNVNEGSVLRFKGTWMRLARRAVRDYNFRGTGVDETLEMWANVRRGEKLYISPFKNRANIIFDSSLPYEVSVMRNYAVPLLQSVPEENERHDELLELIRAFEWFEPIDPDLVAKDSLIREFIGGGSYKYH